MTFNKKYLLPIVGFSCLLIGFASAAIITGYNGNLVNIFDRTRKECPGVQWVNMVDSTQKVIPVKIEGELYFAGERVPLEDPEVKERLERELQINAYWHSNTILSMKLANRYFNDIEKILEENNVPNDFKYLPLVESAFRNETSPAGAVGFWQFVKGTGQSYGLEINDEVDERYNYEKSTRAACKFLSEAKNRLGSWTTAAASYNLGVPGMAQRMKDQKTANYYEMFFNQETSRYVFRMLAMKIIFSNPEKAGFPLKAEDLYQPYRYTTVEVDSTIGSIADFAANYNLKYKHIKMLNPWLRDAQLLNRLHKKYQIKVLLKN